ncbi:hypothetical protein MACJ_002657 [Theileria orientalis]|uniref:Uncharacterized protein n=1 Tax=Theileria orientalis TaxID=68886 RepID=A0A976QSU7_THEOR|nr:hypothetical protein MACJ_002657 [Theileria orientalis]
MNIFRVFNTISYALFIYLLLFSRRNLVESNGTSGSTHLTSPKTNPAESGDGSHSTPPTSGDDGSTVNPGQGSTATPPADTANKTSFELDIKKDAGTNEFDYKKDNKIATFTAKDNYAFNVVKQDKNEIWRTDKETEYASKVVLNGKGQKEKIVTIYLPNNTTKSYKKDGKNKPWNEYTGPLPSTGKAKSSNSSDGSEFELDIKSDNSDSDNYSIVNASFGTKIYKIKRNAKCNAVKVDGKENTLIPVKNGRQLLNQNLKVQIEINNEEVGVLAVIVEKTDLLIQLVPKSGEGGKVFNTISYALFIYLLLFSRRNLVESNGTSAVASQSYGPGTVLSNKTGVDLSLKATKAKEEFNYNKSGQVVTFTAKGNYGFKSVKTGNKVVWETANSSEYATKVVLNGKGQKKKTVTIHLPNNTTKVFKRDDKNKPWNEVKQHAKDSVNTTSTTPAGGNAHGGASAPGSLSAGGQGGALVTPPANNLSESSPSTPPGTTNEGQSSTNPPENGGSPTNEGSRGHKGGESRDGSKVTTPPSSGIDGRSDGTQGGGASPPDNGYSGISASQTNDLMEKFDKLVGDKLEPSDYLKDIKLFKADPNDTTKTKELTTSDYKVKKHADENLYVFNHGVNCTLIKRDNNDLWKYDSSKSDAKYPKGMNVENDLIFIYFGEYTESYSKRTGEWKLSSTVKKDLSSLKVMADVDKSKQDRT